MRTDDRDVAAGGGWDVEPRAGGGGESGVSPQVHRFGPGESASTAAVLAVAAARDRPVTALAPLYDAVDPDALDRLVEPPGTGADGGTVAVTFEYEGTTVTVDSSRCVFVHR